MRLFRDILRGTSTHPLPELISASGIAGPVRVYTGQGKAHLTLAVPVTSVLCGWPPSAGGWRGTGSQAEREWAAALDECRLCKGALTAMGGQ